MERVELCAECGALLHRTALINLAVSYEEDDDTGEIFEQVWHKACYLKYLKRTMQTNSNETANH